MSVNRKNIYVLLVSILFLCSVIASCTSASTHSEINNTFITVTPEEQITYTPHLTPDATIAPTPTIGPYTSIIIGSTGDIMIHEMMLKDAQHMAEGEYTYTTNGDEHYSFDHWFRYIAESIEYADLMIGNFETTIAIDNSTVAGYPYFATPAEIIHALDRAGFDVLLNGNNHILDKGQEGLIATITALDEAQLHHTGAWKSLQEKNTPLVLDVQGIKIGIISATCSLNDMDSLLSEEEQQYMYLRTNDINDISQQIANCKNFGAEVIVMCPHWGYEYKELPNGAVIDLAREYIKLGVDIIFAHHPHVLQPVDNIEVVLDDGSTREGTVFYSLGNFISNQMGNLEQLASAIAYISITRDNSTGQITIDSTNYLPIWCYIEYDGKTNSKTYCVLPAGETLDNSQSFSDIDVSSITYPLKDAWILATNRLGYDSAEPLRSVPVD